MNRWQLQMERHQIAIYGIALCGGLAGGLLWPSPALFLEHAIPWSIALLMYAMFSQIPFFRLKEALRNRRFMGALLVVNYVAVPLLVWGLTYLLPDEPFMLLGVLLVLLTPCIDYVIVFARLGGGDEKLVLVATPLLFVTQMALLPLYLWLFMGEQPSQMVQPGPFLSSFVVLIVLPLLLALLTQRLAARMPVAARLSDWSALLPVPMMALVLLVVAASQIGKVYDSLTWIARLVPVYVLFMALVPFIAWLVARLFRLDNGAGRALLFSGATRNSLVVLPLALALPEPGNSLVAAVIVTQTVVELAGELVYIRVVPLLWRKTNRP